MKLIESIQVYKLSLPLRGALTQATGHSAGSGFEEIDPRASEGDQLAQRVAAGLETAGLPFILTDLAKEGLHAAAPGAIPKPQTTSQKFSLPTRKGASFMRTMKAYRAAVDDGEGDPSQVLMVAAANGINPAKIVQTYKQEATKRRKRAAQ